MAQHYRYDFECHVEGFSVVATTLEEANKKAEEHRKAILDNAEALKGMIKKASLRCGGPSYPAEAPKTV